MFDFTNESVSKELKLIFVVNKSITSYKSHPSLVFDIPKAKTPHFSLNTLRYDGVDLWINLYHALLYKERNLTKTKLKKITSKAFPGHKHLTSFHLNFVSFFSILLQPKLHYLYKI